MSAATPQLPQHTKISGFTGSGKTLHVMARVLNPCPSREDFSRSLFSPYLSTTDVRSLLRICRHIHSFRQLSLALNRLEGKARGIPHLAKNERDIGHPAIGDGREPKGAWTGLALVAASYRNPATLKGR